MASSCVPTTCVSRQRLACAGNNRGGLHLLDVMVALTACFAAFVWLWPLLQAMMAEDPTKRPSAEEVMRQAAAFSSKAGLPVTTGSARRSL
jgi:hypothetical protein